MISSLTRSSATTMGHRPPAPAMETVWEEAQEFSHTPGYAAAEQKDLSEPNLYLYDAYPGGIGLSEPLYRVHGMLVRKTRELILGCPCEKGCPSCVGPAGENGERAKEAALAILERLEEYWEA